MDPERDGRLFPSLISIVFLILSIDTGRVETRGTCHYFSIVKKNWTTALDICMGMSMCLADFDTLKHFEILDTLKVNHTQYWFGLNRHFQPEWEYVSNNHKTRYLPPAHNLKKPNRNCGLLRAVRKRTYGVNSEHCEQEKMFVCAESVFCRQKKELTRYSSGYNTLPRPGKSSCNRR
ncbi:C-type lectin domain family 2 member D3-like [Drosophila madeirensis]|uniref:C-type lectin domain family 2 member D3-like n=1 Tax=Drosophila madeirensis TaxID=30013 RepID=A0AAU9GBP9_DROMD